MITNKTCFLVMSAVVLLLMPTALIATPSVTVYPAPQGETLSSDYALQVEGQSVPVYIARVAPASGSQRLDAMDYSKNVVGHIFDQAAFAYFDMQGTVHVTVSYKEPVTFVKLLPDLPGTKLVMTAKTVSFSLSAPGNITLQVNHDLVHTLHIFANPPETNAPSPKDPNIVYFGPGIHDITNLVVGDGKTLYIAGGAIVRTVAGPSESFQTNASTGQKIYEPAITIKGSGIKVRGRGIIDGSMVSQGKKLLQILGDNISVEGIILRDPSTWTMPIRNSKEITVDNVKIIGYRLNSDGVDITSSRDITIQHCFIRTFDDLIVVKSLAAGGPSANIVAHDNALWNEKGHAMSVGAEVQADISDITFTNNDVIEDIGHDWTMRVFLSDTGNVSNIKFENIRVNQRCIKDMPVNQCPALISLSIVKSSWGRGGQLGTIRNVTFENIQDTSSSPRDRITLAGASATSDIEGVVFDNVVVNGHPISKADVKQNSFVKNVTIRP